MLSDHGVQFIGSWCNGKLEGDVILKNSDGSEKKARYKEGKFLDWLDNNNKGDLGLSIKESTNDKKKGIFACCHKST